jgi:cytidylate kinase
MKEQTREEPKIMAAAERKMQAWAFAEQIADRAIRIDRGQHEADRLGDFITLSREAGAGGGQIAEMIGRKLGWEVLDKNLLDRVAARCHIPIENLRPVDETKPNWAYDALGSWLDSNIVPQEKYVAHLSRIVTAAARHGNVVLVGRGANCILPRNQGMSVRIIASEKYRVQEIMKREGLDEAAAKRFVAKIDRGRGEFVRFFFRRDVADPHLYDLVIDVESLGPERTAELITQACGR